MSDHDPRPDASALPWSCEAEQSVLGALLVDNAAYDRAADLLRRQDFFDTRHGDIWDAISRLVLAMKPADVVTVFDALPEAKREEIGGLAYLGQLAACVPSAANLRRYAEIVRERAMQRALMQTADEALEVARGEGSFEEKSDRIGSLFATVRETGQRSKPLFVGDLMAQRVDHYNALAQGTVTPGISTGIPGLDEALGGGMWPGKVIVLAARPGVGKTSLAQQILLHGAEAGHTGLLLSQEMERTELVDRAVANLGSIGYSRLLNGKLSNPEWQRLGPAVDRLAALPFAIDDQAALTLHDIRTKAFAIKGLRLLAIDYVQLCAAPKGAPRNHTRNDVLTEISRGIKALAKDLGLTVLLLSQLNRDVEKRSSPEPTLADLRESGAIEQDADVIAFLWRVREYESHRLIACSLPKNRQAKPGAKLGLDFEGHYQRWRDSAEKVGHTGSVGGSADLGFN
ncbi:MAG: replicative DNA helicase [Burkholderiales bacterium]|nr:MAG: replicative DNA helicase [Burkholderiales bacterium]